MTEAELRALFLLAGIPVLKVYEIANGYWPDAYVELRAKSPWWLVKFDADLGLIKIGWRKSVIAIDWSDTPIRAEVTHDSVTKSDTMVHAWSYGKAVDYLYDFKRFVERYKYQQANPPAIEASVAS